MCQSCKPYTTLGGVKRVWSLTMSYKIDVQGKNLWTLDLACLTLNALQPVYTCNFCRDFRCDFLLLMDVNKWISYECSDEGTCTLNIRNSSTRSHASEGEYRTRNRSKNCKCKHGPLLDLYRRQNNMFLYAYLLKLKHATFCQHRYVAHRKI